LIIHLCRSFHNMLV